VPVVRHQQGDAAARSSDPCNTLGAGSEGRNKSAFDLPIEPPKYAIPPLVAAIGIKLSYHLGCRKPTVSGKLKLSNLHHSLPLILWPCPTYSIWFLATIRFNSCSVKMPIPFLVAWSKSS
jgi:hypothetical protein